MTTSAATTERERTKRRGAKSGREQLQKQKQKEKAREKGAASAAQRAKPSGPRKAPPPAPVPATDAAAEGPEPVTAPGQTPEEVQRAVEHRLKLREFRNTVQLIGFPKAFAETQIRRFFEQYGRLKRLYWPRLTNGQPRGSGLIQFENPVALRSCLDDTVGQLVGDRSVTVREMLYEDWDPVMLKEFTGATVDNLSRNLQQQRLKKVRVVGEFYPYTQRPVPIQQEYTTLLELLEQLGHQYPTETAPWKNYGWLPTADGLTAEAERVSAVWTAAPPVTRENLEEALKQRWAAVRQLARAGGCVFHQPKPQLSTPTVDLAEYERRPGKGKKRKRTEQAEQAEQAEAPAESGEPKPKLPRKRTGTKAKPTPTEAAPQPQA